MPPRQRAQGINRRCETGPVAFFVDGCPHGAVARVWAGNFDTNGPELVLPTTATVLRFVSSIEVGGIPHLSGSDGSSVDGSSLVVTGRQFHIGTSTISYESTISGLHANTRYTVSFSSLSRATGVAGVCDYPGLTAGTFRTS